MADEGKKLRKNEVQLTEDYLRQTVYWILNKFMKDSFHKQHNSSRNDLIGGFLDRWVNKIPEYLIFDKLLNDKPYDPVTDFFLYDQETAKNAPDILGLKFESGIYFPFTKFKNNRWDTPDEMPFVEMKVFRENHKLITIPARQFKPNRFYAIVVSHIRDDYIMSLFDMDFFDNKYLNRLSKIEEFIGVDEGNQLLTPEKLIKHELGTYELLGIYKWETLKDHCIKVGLKNKKPESPIYLKEIEEYVNEDEIELNSGAYNHFYKIKEIPIFIELNTADDEINLVSVNDLILIVEIEGSVKINNNNYSSGYYKMIFTNEYHNAVKYYILDSIEPINNPIINQVSPLYSGLLFHDGTNQMMVSCDLRCDDATEVNIINSPKNKIQIEVNGLVHINDDEYCDGTYGMELKKDNDNKKIKSLIYRIPKSINSIENNINYKVTCPQGKFKFLNHSSEDVFSKIDIQIKENSKLNKLFSQKFNKKKSTIFSIDGEAFIEGIRIYDGFYRITFNERNECGIKYYEFESCTEVNNPLLTHKDEFIINDSFYIHQINGKKVIPSFIQVKGDSKIFLLKKTNEEAIIQVEGSAIIDNKELFETKDKNLYENMWRLTFKPFERDSKVEEYVLSKEVLSSAIESDEKELISIFDKICGNNK